MSYSQYLTFACKTVIVQVLNINEVKLQHLSLIQFLTSTGILVLKFLHSKSLNLNSES